MTLSVRSRLTLWYAGGFALTALAFSVATYAFVRVTLVRTTDRHLDRAVAVLEAVIVGDPSELDDPHELTEIEEFGQMGLFHVSVDGRLLRDTAGWRRAELDTTFDNGRTDPHELWISPQGDPYYLKSVVLPIRGQEVRIAVAVGGAPTQETLGGLVRALLLGFSCVLALAVVGGYLLAGRVLAPVDAMASKAREITAERLSERLPIDNPDDEFGRLAVAFNNTLARVENAFEQLKRFTADASHELRTPLTALRSVGEVGLQDASDPEAYRDVIGSMLEETQRLTRLVDTLLTLARADSGRIRVDPVPSDLGDLVVAVCDDLGVLAEEKGQALSVDADPSIMAEVDPVILRHALINIVDNAIKHTQANGEIRIAVKSRQGEASIAVTDNGPGIPDGHQEKIFDRFHRVDGGRSSSTGGAGLGLAIALWAVENTGGRLELVTEEGEGSTFLLTFPSLRSSDRRHERDASASSELLREDAETAGQSRAKTAEGV